MKVLSQVLCAAALTALSALPLAAQPYPNKPVRIVVPAAAGGGSDLLARYTAQYFDQQLNQRFTVDNRPGAGGNLGAELTAKAAPDGYTLCLITVGNVAINQYIMKDMPFDPVSDLAPVALVGNSVQTLVVPPNLPANTVAEFISLAKREAGKINYGSAGIGTTTHLAAEMFSQMAGIEMVHVPYRGSAPALVDIMAGRIQLGFFGLSAFRSQLDAGALKVLAVAYSSRLQSAPNIPTVMESGLPGYEFVTWFALVTTKGTPPDIISLLNRTTIKMMDDPGYQKVLFDGGLEPIRETPEQFATRIKADDEKFSKLVKSIGLKPE